MESMSQTSQNFVTLLKEINVVWTVLNLLPIQPLDGGQIFRDFMGPHRRDVVRWVSVIIASLVAFWALRVGLLFLCMMMAYMAFMNYQHTPGKAVWLLVSLQSHECFGPSLSSLSWAQNRSG